MSGKSDAECAIPQVLRCSEAQEDPEESEVGG